MEKMGWMSFAAAIVVILIIILYAVAKIGIYIVQILNNLG